MLYASPITSFLPPLSAFHRAAGSNLRMVRPGSMSTVKPLMICGCEARGKSLDQAGYLAVRRRSRCTSASNWELYHYFVFLPCKQWRSQAGACTLGRGENIILRNQRIMLCSDAHNSCQLCSTNMPLCSTNKPLCSRNMPLCF